MTRDDLSELIIYSGVFSLHSLITVISWDLFVILSQNEQIKSDERKINDELAATLNSSNLWFEFLSTKIVS